VAQPPCARRRLVTAAQCRDGPIAGPPGPQIARGLHKPTFSAPLCAGAQHLAHPHWGPAELRDGRSVRLSANGGRPVRSPSLRCTGGSTVRRSLQHCTSGHRAQRSPTAALTTPRGARSDLAAIPQRRDGPIVSTSAREAASTLDRAAAAAIIQRRRERTRANRGRSRKPTPEKAPLQDAECTHAARRQICKESGPRPHPAAAERSRCGAGRGHGQRTG
jgi:hypothetical protein